MVGRVGALSARSEKVAGSFDRQVALPETLSVARSLCERYGITRIADTTHLDRIGIPTISAVVPGSPDKLGVYNGKGLTREGAMAGALMEAIERQICARFEAMRTYDASVSDIDRVLDLRAMGWLGEIDDDMVRCVRGINLLDGELLDVPVELVRSPQLGERRFNRTSTNGLASGNTRVEALYHALMEVIERHLWSKVHLLAHAWPRSLRARANVDVEQPDDPVASDVVDAAEHPVLAEPIARIRKAGLGCRLLAYTEPNCPVAMMAVIVDPVAHELFYHLGFGCSWSPLHASVRAITEAVQVRVTDIQGAREDMKRAKDGPLEAFDRERRPGGFPTGGRWYFDGPAQATTLAELPDSSDPDLARDLDRIVQTLREYGEKCVAYVDLTPPDIPISVMRVVVPHLERTLVDGTISARMQAFLRNPLLR